MGTILYLQASPRGERSHSIAVGDAFLREYTHRHPETTATTLNLYETDLPPFDALAAQGKYAIMHGEETPTEARAAWARVEAVIQTFTAADLYLLAVPMWNFGIPYRLKHYIDLVCQPTYTFEVGEAGYAGLLQDRRAVIAYASGGEYSAMPELDHQKPYLRQILGFMGIKDQHEVVAAPTMAGNGAEIRDKAIEKARLLAQSL